MGDFEAAFAIAGSIPGWLMPEEARRLYLVGLQAEGDVVEIGTYFGKSTFLIARGLQDSGRGHRLLTIDMHIGADGQPLTAEPPAFLAGTLKSHGLLDVVTQVIGWSSEAVSWVDFARVATVFIDGGHDYESVSRDILAVRGRLGPQTQLLFHDYHSEFSGVVRAVDELVRTDPHFEFVELVHSLFICRMGSPVAHNTGALGHEIDGLRARLATEAEGHRQSQAEVHALRTSTAWRLTAPARWTMDLLRGRR